MGICVAIFIYHFFFVGRNSLWEIFREIWIYLCGQYYLSIPTFNSNDEVVLFRTLSSYVTQQIRQFYRTMLIVEWKQQQNNDKRNSDLSWEHDFDSKFTFHIDKCYLLTLGVGILSHICKTQFRRGIIRLHNCMYHHHLHHHFTKCCCCFCAIAHLFQRFISKSHNKRFISIAKDKVKCNGNANRILKVDKNIDFVWFHLFVVSFYLFVVSFYLHLFVLWSQIIIDQWLV